MKGLCVEIVSTCIIHPVPGKNAFSFTRQGKDVALNAEATSHSGQGFGASTF